MANGRSWTEADMQRLTELYPTMKAADVAQKMGRTVGSIYQEAFKLKLTKSLSQSQLFLAWTPQDLQRLQDLWGKKTLPQIAKLLGRRESAVRDKAKRLQLGRIIDSSNYIPARVVGRLVGVDDSTVVDSWIGKYGLKFRKIRLYGKKVYTCIHISNLISWLKDNQDRWDSRRLKLNALGSEPTWLKAKRKADELSPPHKPQPPLWTPEEDEILVRMYKLGDYTCQEIGDRLGRSVGGVYHRVSKLDIWGTGKVKIRSQKGGDDK